MVIVTVPAVRVAPLALTGKIVFTLRWPRSTMESVPAPPGETKAQFKLGDTETRGVGPV